MISFTLITPLLKNGESLEELSIEYSGFDKFFRLFLLLSSKKLFIILATYVLGI